MTILPDDLTDLARASGLVDDVWLDERPRGLQLGRWWALRRRLRSRRFAWVYDLQTSARTASYWRWMGKPDWSGHVPGASLPDPDPDATYTRFVSLQHLFAQRVFEAGDVDQGHGEVSAAHRRVEADTVEATFEQALQAGVGGIAQRGEIGGTGCVARTDGEKHHACR